MTTPLDLSTLPPPQSIEVISFEQILAAMLADLRARSPEFNNLSEADPAYKILQVCAYRETLLRQRENSKTQALLLAFATGGDLDHIGVTYYNGTARLVVQAANPLAVPPLPQVTESDDDYRRRLLLQPNGESVAGPEQAYIYHALSAHGGVQDATATSPWPSGVVLTVLGRDGQAPTAEALQAVARSLGVAQTLPLASSPIPTATDLAGGYTGYTPDTLRPVADRVILRPATLVHYSIDANVTTASGPDVRVLVDLIKANLQAYKTSPRRLGKDIARSAIFAAIHISGVELVTINTPALDVQIDAYKAGICDAIAVRVNGEAFSL